MPLGASPALQVAGHGTNVKTGEPGSPIPPPGRGMGTPGFPMPPPAGGCGRAQPSQEEPVFIPSVCGGAAWTAEVTIVRSVQPPSQPPPAGGAPGARPRWGGSGRGPAPCPRSRGAGGTPALPGRLHRALCAPRMGPNVNIGCWSRGVGQPRFPIPPPARRFREGFCLPERHRIPRVSEQALSLSPRRWRSLPQCSAGRTGRRS